ncbi:MAG: hypothetical protein K0R71_589 [Bacillales bacterium]|jgi:hypothetical protein|nr:hypothetical protein [Bacillales bacterium]
MNVELLDLTQRLQEEYNDFHESLFKMRMNSFFEFEEVYGVNVDLKGSTLESLESLAIAIAIKIQDIFEELENDKRFKHWVDLFITLCANIIDLIQHRSISKIPKLVHERASTALDHIDGSNSGDMDSNVKQKTELELVLSKAEDEIYELDERCKQLLSLLLGLSFQKY